MFFHKQAAKSDEAGRSASDQGNVSVRRKILSLLESRDCRFECRLGSQMEVRVTSGENVLALSGLQSVLSGGGWGVASRQWRCDMQIRGCHNTGVTSVSLFVVSLIFYLWLWRSGTNNFLHLILRSSRHFRRCRWIKVWLHRGSWKEWRQAFAALYASFKLSLKHARGGEDSR